METKTIKRIIAAVAIIFMISLNLSSQNLVNNPSFEDTVYCPNGTNQMDACQHWMSFGNSPDYFNVCSPAGLSPPNVEFGYQYPHGGVAMIGLATYRWPGSPDGPNYREYVGAQLSQPLIIGQKYYMSFFVNFAFGPSVAIATNKIGLRFSTINYTTSNVAPINNIVYLFTDSIISDSIIWYKISGSFIADSTYNYVAIGNFFQDSLTDTIHVGTALPDYSYYYIDDVCVSTDSLYNENWTGIVKPDEKVNFKIFPNPASDHLNIENIENSEIEIRLFDAIGKIVLNIKKIPTNNKVIMNLSSIVNGYYIISLKNKNNIFNSPLIINR
jgi:hypothetical protein